MIDPWKSNDLQICSLTGFPNSYPSREKTFGTRVKNRMSLDITFKSQIK